jgi:hypothetical protein
MKKDIRHIDSAVYHLGGNRTNVRFIAVLYETVVNEHLVLYQVPKFDRK